MEPFKEYPTYNQVHSLSRESDMKRNETLQVCNYSLYITWTF